MNKILTFIGLLFGLYVTTLQGFALAQNTISFDDIPRNSAESILLADSEGWMISGTAPDTILSDHSSLKEAALVNTLNIDSLRNILGEKRYGWAELSVLVSKDQTELPRSIKFSGYAAANIWLNGDLVYKSGKVSTSSEGELLNTIYIIDAADIQLKEGMNHFLVEFSFHDLAEYLHSVRSYPKLFVRLYLVPQAGQADLKLRIFIFGAALFTILILLIVHAFLYVKSVHKYHSYAAFTNAFILMHIIFSLGHLIIDIRYNSIVIQELVQSVVFFFVVYYLILSIRSFYQLPIPFWKLRLALFIGVTLGLAAMFFNHKMIAPLQAAVFVLVFVYAILTIRQTIKAKSGLETRSLFAGFIVTLFGSFCYLFLYNGIFYGNELVYLLSIVSIYIGIPLSFLITIAKNFARLYHSIEEEVAERTMELKEKDAFKTRFLANISHELRTPITILRGLLSKTIKEKKGHSIISIPVQESSMIFRNVERLSTLVRQIVEVSNSDSINIHLNIQNVSISGLVQESINLTTAILENKKQQILVFHNSKDVAVETDKEKVITILTNLITNASKFSPQNTTIRIESRLNTSTKQLELDVIDEGIGVKEDESELIFERFFRLRNPDKNYVEGMGIGLDLSRTLARKLGGNLMAVPQSKKGARFRLKLPLSDIQIYSNFEAAADSLQGQNQKNDSKAVANGGKAVRPNILLVEDNPDMQLFLSHILKEIGEISLSSDGLEALEQLNRRQFDLIVTDLMMPNMSGEEFIKTVGEDPKFKSIPVVVLSAKNIHENRLQLLRVGVIDYMTKPFDSEELILKIRNLLELSTRRKKAVIKIDEQDIDVGEDLSDAARDFVISHIDDNRLSVDILAKHFSMSQRTLYRKIEYETGMTPAAFIREVRLQYAAKLIEHSGNDLRLNEIASKVGYKSPASFKKVYLARFGKLPL